MFEPIDRQSLSSSVFDQLRAQIVNRQIDAGEALPSERLLCELLNVNRGAVREGIKRLQQAGLVEVRQGGPTRVLDYQSEAGMELLPALIVDERGSVKISIAKGILQMRSSLAPDVAAHAARQPHPELAAALRSIVAEMRTTESTAQLQELAFHYWQTLVQQGGQLTYKLAFNSLRKAYRPIMAMLTHAMADEFRDLDRLHTLATAIEKGDSTQAAQLATEHTDIGKNALDKLLDSYAANNEDLPL